MILALIVCTVFALLVIMACCKVSANSSREAEQHDPCDSCLRWSECNGVDEGCPWRAENGD